MNLNEILSREVLPSPNRTAVDVEQRQISVLNLVLKEAIVNELKREKSKWYIEEYKLVV